MSTIPTSNLGPLPLQVLQARAQACFTPKPAPTYICLIGSWRTPPPARYSMTGLIILGILALLVIFLISMYNSLVRLKVQCDNAWADIDVQLKRRYDLIPNLVETVKGYAAHEKETLTNVIAARNNAAASTGDPARLSAAEGQLTGTLRQLFAVAEAYPDLKANQNFLALQSELSQTENVISSQRQQ